MLIGICGTIYAGKHSVQDYLVERHAFKALELAHDFSGVETPASQDAVPRVQRAHTSRVSFATVDDLLDFATQNWQQRFCTTSIHNEATVEALCHRPFFLLLHIDAPLFTRWQRFKTRCAPTSTTPPTLEQFVQSNDTHLYNSTNGGLAALASRAHIQLLNSTTSLPALHSALDALNLTDESRLRPTWDHYFMTLASLAARRSNCMRRQVGCVLVRENRVIATGYNGTPRHITNCNAGGCSRCNDGGGSSGVGLSTCLCLHAEENALLEAGRERVGGGAVLYCNTCPCLTCSIKIVQVGIAEVVFNRSYWMDAETAKIFREAGVQLRQFSPPKEGLVNLVDEPAGARLGSMEMAQRSAKSNGVARAAESNEENPASTGGIPSLRDEPTNGIAQALQTGPVAAGARRAVHP
ncbi:Deoxycytidine monophosphate (dCMP) deaminase [Friedmanniomyces endolithicus]|uniref:Deoxycytidylate deaminase n=1 Tax=Friedmanniomyces endolithicus TaxID=329885 RepID=A0A4U0V993_9PEZI|nr:Deoxycytidine monophosphate (dCMP) deaminase [Friedmanniomyces endolithicus]KAK0363462.1 Deoxycytidine monophosphate (dCMP) deaminase [Friedmanniomyces endolithicus]KAK0780791.1 Deoxycytidine monophosphate (dCMP) deaminase [Friedmanniomyces endolithicus]KAK0792009.1 Deoxycytidine monophosphate (dCMP) deaminase [Friedmanniomyces endolithicus]KAK0800504.1 Deoxycytidine monophosphate (dCMP) deaminase [Friedmanniomyces endolithicus]